MINQFDWIGKWAIYSPDKIALKELDSDRQISYKALNRQAQIVSSVFQSIHNLEKGDRIVILAENCLEYYILFSMAQKTGVILVPLNYRLSSNEIRNLITDAQPKLIILETKFKPLVAGAEQSIKVININQLDDLEGPEDLVPATLNEDDPIFILYTSGSTGLPKGVLYTHKMLFWNSVNTSLSLGINASSRTINFMPPFHTGGWNVLTTPFLHRGAYTCFLKKFDAEHILKIVQEESINLFMAVPTMLSMISSLANFETADLSVLDYLIVGGEALPLNEIEKWHHRGVPIRQGYGMTEVGPNLTSLHQDDAIEKKGSIGRPNFYLETKVDTESGELLLRGPVVTPGYWNNETATNDAFRDGWFCTGDVVEQDEDGYLFIVDRLKNMYISGGENIYPAEVERVLCTHQNILNAVVIGIPDDKWGEVGKAFVEVNQSIQPAEILEYCKQYLAKFKVPKQLLIVNELPKNATGKVDRKKLRLG